MRFKNFLLNEAAGLSGAELVKPNSKTSEPRIDILRKKILNNEPLDLVDGGSFLVTDIKDALNKLNKFNEKNPESFKLTGKTSNDKEISILTSKLLKTKEFGGQSSGSGGGASSTDLNESAQCYYCSAVCNIFGKPMDKEYFTPDVLKNSAIYVDATTKVENVISDLSDEWVESSVKIANKLFKDGYIKSGMFFHRGSDLMKKIYSSAKKAAKNSDLKINFDKWNPGDIWACYQNFNPNNLNTTSISALNEQLIELFNTKVLIGISLKKVKKEPNIKIFNKDKDKPNFRPISYELVEGKTSNFDSTTKVILKYNVGEAQGRTFNYLSNWAFEIKGKYAAGGKCGLSAIMSILKFNNIRPPKISYNSVKKLSIEVPNNFKNEMFQLYEKFDKKNKFNFEQFSNLLDEKSKSKEGVNWIFSKYIGMKLFETFENAGNKDNDIVNDIVNYALSSSSFSSIFIKVS